jgi:hypothetical protein
MNLIFMADDEEYLFVFMVSAVWVSDYFNGFCD